MNTNQYTQKTLEVCFILAGFWKKVNVYDAFIEGAKEGFTTAVKIIPYLVAILTGCHRHQSRI